MQVLAEGVHEPLQIIQTLAQVAEATGSRVAHNAAQRTSAHLTAALALELAAGQGVRPSETDEPVPSGTASLLGELAGGQGAGAWDGVIPMQQQQCRGLTRFGREAAGGGGGCNGGAGGGRQEMKEMGVAAQVRILRWNGRGEGRGVITIDSVEWELG